MSERPSPSARSVGSIVPLALLLQLGCGEGEYITLGQGDPRPRFLDSGRLIRNINSPDNDDNPTLTRDMLEIYFTSNREGGSGGSDVWYAKRGTRSEPFGRPDPVGAANSEENETSAAISPDGTTLWVGSERPIASTEEDNDDINIWVMTRADTNSQWGPLRPLMELNSTADDIPRPLGLNGTVMPMARRNNDNDYQTFLATREGVEGEFLDPRPIPELSEQGQATVDAFLTNDGLLLFFNRTEGSDGGDLFMAWRRSPDASFIEALPLTDVNGGDEGLRDPWVNFDGTRFVFASEREGGLGETDIYMAFIELPIYRGSR